MKSRNSFYLLSCLIRGDVKDYYHNKQQQKESTDFKRFSRTKHGDKQKFCTILIRCKFFLSFNWPMLQVFRLAKRDGKCKWKVKEDNSKNSLYIGNADQEFKDSSKFYCQHFYFKLSWKRNGNLRTFWKLSRSKKHFWKLKTFQGLSKLSKLFRSFPMVLKYFEKFSKFHKCSHFPNKIS